MQARGHSAARGGGQRPNKPTEKRQQKRQGERRMLQQFDAFPKVERTYATRPPQNYVLNVFFSIVAVFILYLETTTWMGAAVHHEFDVYKGITKTFQINLDITVMDRCDKLRVYVQDASDDVLLVNELTSMIRWPAEDGSNGEWCRIRGIFDTNRVSGHLSIDSVGFKQTFDSSHQIHELSFGEYYPSQVNPLDSTERTFEEPMLTTYFLTIVPTTYVALGAELETNQYSVTVRSRTLQEAGVPGGIYFLYDFEPIAVRVIDKRMSFFEWLMRVTNIVGGVIFAARALNGFFGHKRGVNSDRGREGLLDKPIKRQ